MCRNLSVVEPSVERWDPNIVINTFQSLITIFIIIGNGTLLQFIIKFKKKLLKPNLFILSLTISDLLTGMIGTPMAHIVSHQDVSQIFCDAYLSVAQFLARISSTTIMIISIDRFMKLSFPIKYKTSWTSTTRRILIVSSVWTLSAIITCIKLMDSVYNSGNYTKGCFFRSSYTKFEQMELIFSLFAPNIVALIFYVKILLLVRSPTRPLLAIKRQSKETVSSRSASLEIKSDTNDTNAMIAIIDSDASIIGTPCNVLRKHRGSYTPIEVKVRCHSWRPSIILGLIIILNFIFVAIPPFVYSLFIICEDCSNESIMSIVPWFFWMSCAVNPPIFALLNNSYRSFILSYVPFCGCCK